MASTVPRKVRRYVVDRNGASQNVRGEGVVLVEGTRRIVHALIFQQARGRQALGTTAVALGLGVPETIPVDPQGTR